jgi:hypothetical protein
MNDLNRALGDIRNIRRQVALTTEFRGYGSLALAATGLAAIIAGVVQAHWVAAPSEHPMRYATVWSATAVVSGAIIFVETLMRSRRVHSGMANEMIGMAATQFAPAAIAGSLLTIVLVFGVDNAAVVRLLPGLWQIIYSLGIFASCRFLPRAVSTAGVWYLATGLLCLATSDLHPLSPWHMAFPFGVGQGMLALILHREYGKDTHEA